MDPAFCVTTLDRPVAQHLLVRKETEPEKIAQLIAEEPAQLIAEALFLSQQRHHRHRPRNHARAGAREEKFKKCGPPPRRPLPRIPHRGPEKKTECYVLRDEPVAAETESSSSSTPPLRRRRIHLADELSPPPPAGGQVDFALILKAWPKTSKTATSSTPRAPLRRRRPRQPRQLAAVDPATLEPSQASLVANARDLTANRGKDSGAIPAPLLTLVKTRTPSSAANPLQPAQSLQGSSPPRSSIPRRNDFTRRPSPPPS